MAQQLVSLKEDGYLNVEIPSQNIIYHPPLNIILCVTTTGLVHVLNVNSGHILQTSTLSAKNNANIRCRYLEDQNKILFIDGQGIGIRSDYNGMLLLDTILQRRLKSSDDNVKLELLLSEAILFQQSLKSIDLPCTDLHSDVLNELTEKITRAQSQPKTGIKAQKWNTVCLELKLSTLRSVAVRVVSELKRQNRHVPALAVAAGICERLSELAPRERMAVCDRAAMYSEAKRRETFVRWPHMDYKWALPEQMAQAGFYHQPNSAGDDRVMCFTCTVCLVSWERTDEPWSEHERHSQSCPFVKGEYTQNVPISVTYATTPALDVAPRGHGGATLIAHTNVGNLIAFGHSGGMVSVYNVSGKLRRTHCFYVTQDNRISDNTQNVLKRGNNVALTSLCVVGEQKRITTPQHKVCNIESETNNVKSNQIRPSIICGVTISPKMSTVLPDETLMNPTFIDEDDDVDEDATIVDESSTIKALNNQNQQKSELADNLMLNQDLDTKLLYLAVYDFQYKSAACSNFGDDKDAQEALDSKNEQNFSKSPSDILISKFYNSIDDIKEEEVDAISVTPTSGGGTKQTTSIDQPFVVCNDLSPKSYQNLIPQDNTNSIFIPPDVGKLDQQPEQAQQHNGPRILTDNNMYENTFLLSDKDIDYSFTNGHQLDDADRTDEFEFIEPSTSSEKSISDHIVDIKAKGEKYVTYSHAVQCIQLPDYCQNKNLEISQIIPTKNGAHILVLLRQKDQTILGKSILLIYALNFSYRVVKVEEQPVIWKELVASEQPEEITLFPLLDNVGECAGSGSNSIEGLAAFVCADGAVRLLDLATLSIVSEAKVEGSRYVSLTYCNSLERLCVSTETGPLHFYAILGRDNEFIEKKDEEEISMGSPLRPDSGGSLNNYIISSLETPLTSHIDKMDDENLLITASQNGDLQTFIGMLNGRSTLTAKELKFLHYFCEFDSSSASYCAVLPACWSEMQQCQRKTTQQGTSDLGQHVRTWRLQTDATTWDEHVIELTLPWSACIGHVDLNFSLHTPCPSLPNIQVTLLKQHTSGIGHRKFYNVFTSVDDPVQFSFEKPVESSTMENPILSDEYHRAHNVDILAGPVNLSSYLDLSEQGGTVTLTSPKLLKSRGRTLLVHVKALLDPTKENINERKDSSKKTRDNQKSSYGMPIKFPATPGFSNAGCIKYPTFVNNTNSKKSVESYIGCDWLHEISFSIRTMKLTNLPNERQQRTALLESNHLITILCECACRSGKDRSRLVQAISLDILTWIATIRLGQHKSDLGITFLHNIEPHLYGLIVAGLIDGARSIAHKLTKLLVVCIESGRNMLTTPISQQFDYAVLQALLRTSSLLGRVHSACGLRWFSMLVQLSVTNTQNGSVGAATECLSLIQHAAQYLKARTNPYHQLLRSRFGLYGTPFDPELLDTEPPVFHKSSSLPVTFASVVTSDSFPQASNTNSTPHPNNNGSEHFDLKDLFSMSNVSTSNQSVEPKTPTFTAPTSAILTGGSQVIHTPVPTSTTLFRGLVSNNYLKGLLETEPLYYTCASASEGTRIEKVENSTGNGGLVNNNSNAYTQAVSNLGGNDFATNVAVCPAPVINNPIEFPKLEHGSFMSNLLLPQGIKTNANQLLEKIEQSIAETGETDNGNGNLSENSDVEDNDYYYYLYNKLKIRARKENEKLLSGKPTTSEQPLLLENNPWTQSDPKNDDNKNKIKINTSPLAWQQLLLSPPQHYLVIERMHSGARRFVVLDFGAPILLTDLLIPACNDLVSLSIDVWYQSEDVDCVRLATASDIGTKCLVLSDLQPPPLCRFLKITTIGRYGMSTTRCKIPVGYFYGHAIVLPEDSYQFENIVPDKDQIESLNNILITLFEDINCRYTLACSKLRDLLEPFLLNDDPNTQHMYNYLKKGDKKENGKIYTAYQECINFQHQLNIVRNIIKRLGSYIDQEELTIYESEGNCFQQASTDKLSAICENMLEILLSIVYEIDPSFRTSPLFFKYFNENVCEELFMSLCVGHDIKLQLSTATLLVRMCGLQSWWGTFLADTLTKLYSSHNRQIFPQDRVFIILAYLCRKSLFNGAQRTAIFDPILRTLCELLQPLISSKGLLVAAKIDLGLIGWQLLYLSLSLDSVKFDLEENNFSSRWDWLTTDASVNRIPQNYQKSNPATAVEGYRKKLHKQFLLYKQQLDTLDYTQKHVQASTQALSAMSNHAASLSCKLEMALKQQEQIYKKFNQVSNKHLEDFTVKKYKQYLDNKKTSNKSSDMSSTNQDPSPSPPTASKKLNYEHCLIVCRGLILLILNLDCSCNIDIFLLSCKTIARIIVSTKPTLTLQQLVTHQQLLQLLRLAVRNEGSPWISHAVTCLLQDMLESQKTAKQDQEQSFSAQESNSDTDDNNEWCATNFTESETNLMDVDYFQTMQLLLEQDQFQGVEAISALVKSAAAAHEIAHMKQFANFKSITVSGPLPSLPESDDSDYDDSLEPSTKKSNYKFGVIPVSSISTATDSRLESGLDSKPEITLRRLAMLSSFHLPTAINGAVTSPPEYIKGRYSEIWPDDLLATWQTTAITVNPEVTSVAILTKCFDTLISDLKYSMSAVNVEKVLQLWIAMSWFLSENPNKNNTLNPSTIPGLVVSPESIAQLMETICTIPSMSLRAWTLSFQCLTLTSNLLFQVWSPFNDLNDLEHSLSGLAGYIIKDNSFSKMLLRFFAGNGMVLTEKRLAGPSVSQTLRYLLVRLQVRADVVTPTSRLGCYLKNELLKLVLQLIEPGTGPIATQQGPLDAQFEFIQTISNLDFKNSDLNVINNILKNLGILVQCYMSGPEYVKSVGIIEQKQSQVHNFGNLYMPVLGTNVSKHGKPVTYENLIISLLKFATKLVQIPLPYRGDSTSTDTFEIPEPNNFTPLIQTEVENNSQTDESKAAESQRICNNTGGVTSSNSGTSSTPTTPVPVKLPCVADNVLEDVPTMLRFTLVLNLCSESSLAMIVGAVPNHTITEIGEPTSVGDALFQLLSNITKRCTKSDLMLRSVLEFLTISDRNSSIHEGTPHLSDPLAWWLLQILASENILKDFTKLGGVQLIAKHLVRCYQSAISNLQPATVSQIMQYLSSGSGGQSSSVAYQGGTASSKKMQQANNLEQREGLINFAPLGVISSTSPTAQAADVLIHATIVPHRRARTPQWSYHFYPDENHVELTITLPAAVLLREVQIQPHLNSLATCPSAIALEASRNGSSGLVPICPPLVTSGLSFIRMHLPSPEVVTTVLLRLYKPRDSTNIGLLRIRLLGTAAFGSMNKSSVTSPTTGTDFTKEIQEDEMLSRSSLGWLRLLHQCFNLPTLESDLSVLVVQEATQVENLLETCCGLLLVPSQVAPLLIGGTSNLERVLLKLCLHDASFSFRAIQMLLDNSAAFLQMTSMVQQPTRAIETVCELLYKLCSIQDSNTCHRVTTVLNWLRSSAEKALSNSSELPPNASYIHCIASILWSAQTQNLVYDLKSLVTKDLFEAIYKWTVLQHKISLALKKALDALLCSFCVINDIFFHLLLFKMSVLIPNLSTDRGASVSDDQKDSEGMTDENKQNLCDELNWHSQLVLRDTSTLLLTGSQLSTIATASSSSVAVHQLLDSGLPKLLTNIVFQFCTVCSDILKSVYSIDRKLEDLVQEAFKEYPMMRLEHIVNILNFFADMCFESNMREWLGSTIGSVFWIPLLRLLCHDRSASQNRSILCSGNYYKLEDATIRFLTKCCSLCPNQTLLAACLCDVIEYQKVTPSGISGFTRRLILQLLLENEKIWVSIKADETIYRNVNTPNFMVDFVPHPAYRVTNNHILLHLDTNITLGEIFEQYISFTFENSCSSPSDSQSTKDTKKDVWEVALDMTDKMSVAAGVTAKDKRIKDAKNLIWQSVPSAAAYTRALCAKLDGSSSSGMEERLLEKNRDKRYFRCDQLPYAALSHNVKLSQLLYQLNSQVIKLSVIQNKDVNTVSEMSNDSCQVTSTLHVFSSLGGLAILAQHLPLIYSENIRPSVPTTNNTNNNGMTSEMIEAEWVKLDGSDDIPDDIEAPRGASTPTRACSTTPNVPPHSLAAFALFLRLPGYAEMLLRDYKKAQCLLRLVLGVTDDGEGGDIFQLPIAHSLPTLPFQVLRRLYDTTPVTTDDSQLLRRTSVNCGVIHLLLVCLSVFTHQSNDDPVIQIPIKNGGGVDKNTKTKTDDKTHLYWAKGTGFGTGSTQQSWNVEQALMRQRSEEEHVTVLLQVLSSYINPSRGNSEEFVMENNVPPKYNLDSSDAPLPPVFYDLLKQSCLLPVLCSYLRNDSVLDMARHIPLYRALLHLLRSIAMRRQLVSLLLPKPNSSNSSEVSSNLCVVSLLNNMKLCVDTYASRLKINSKATSNSDTNGSPKVKYNKYSTPATANIDDNESDEGLALLIPDIQATADLVREVLQGTEDLSQSDTNQESSTGSKTQIQRSIIQSLELRYLEVMKKLQFDTFEMIRECTEAEGGGYQFIVSYHFEGTVKAAGDRSHPARVKRLAQEAVTLATSLPLSYSSSVFVRCDADRLDVMKVLITGPADTPYANGCFELDVYFPPEYPQAPMMINLETTGRHTVRFNPNLYNDGKVCLSVLNTWHGRPEEKWNAQTSSFLQVLVSIQSLILVPEPYFNEPGYERSRGTPTGTQSSLEYNANIYQATVRWAMLEQIRNPCPCFKQVIHTHFWLKRHEISAQIERWVMELETLSPDKRTSGTRSTTRRVPAVSALALKHHYFQLYDELSRLKTPEGLEDLEELSSMESMAPLITSSPPNSSSETPTNVQSPSQATSSVIVNETFPSLVCPVTDTSSNSATNQAGSSDVHHDIDTDIEMEKMVSKVCE